MWFVVDIGNTNTVVGIYDDDRLLYRWRISSDHDRTADEQALLLRQLCQARAAEQDRIDAAVIGSVVPSLTDVYMQAVHTLFQVDPIEVTCDLDLGLKIDYRDPAQIGADRLANAVAAHQRYRGPVIVVDFGTATTFDVIADDGEYLGGVIAPGLRTSASDLFARAAKLPRFVEIKEPQAIIGKTTEESLLSGLYYGTIGQVDEIVSRLQTQIGQKTTVVATGGLAHLIAPRSRTIQEVCPDLTLEGLVCIGRRVMPSRP
jgi:type III pantothenate kinase